MQRTKVRLSFLPHKKRLRGIGRSQEQMKLTFRLLEQGGKSIAHCKFVVFTFLPFTFLPFEVEDGGPGRGKLTLRSQGGRALHIANPLTLPFYLLPFYLLREAGGPGSGKLTLRLLGEEHCTLQIA